MEKYFGENPTQVRVKERVRTEFALKHEMFRAESGFEGQKKVLAKMFQVFNKKSKKAKKDDDVDLNACVREGKK